MISVPVNNVPDIQNAHHRRKARWGRGRLPAAEAEVAARIELPNPANLRE